MPIISRTEDTEVKLTVLMSVYNAAAHLEKAVRSILTQTFTAFEFLIINDGSRDQSREILARVTDPRIRIVDTENRGLAAALERGVREARAPYVARMDADDIAPPDRLETQVSYLDRHPDIGVVSADYVEIDPRDVPLRTRRAPALDSSFIISWKLLWENVICHPVVMVRRDLMLAAGINYDPSCVVEDYDVWTRLLFHTHFAHIPRVLLQYRRNPEGMTRTRDRRQFEQTSRIQQRTLSTLLGRSLDPLVGQSVAVLSQQTPGSPTSDAVLDGKSLAALGIQVRDAFQNRFALPPDDRRKLDSDLAARYLDWGMVLAAAPGRAADALGILMRRAVALSPRVVLDRRLRRNVLIGVLGPENLLRVRSTLSRKRLIRTG